jgi:hypothetical protein
LCLRLLTTATTILCFVPAVAHNRSYDTLLCACGCSQPQLRYFALCLRLLTTAATILCFVPAVAHNRSYDTLLCACGCSQPQLRILCFVPAVAHNRNYAYFAGLRTRKHFSNSQAALPFEA